MNFKALCEYVADSGIGLTTGRNLFINQAPITSEPIVALFKQPNAGAEIDPELIGRRRGRFQLVVRADEHEAGEAIAKQLSELLTMVETPLNGILVRSLRPLHEPVSYAVSVGNKIEFSVNFYWIYDIVESK